MPLFISLKRALTVNFLLVAAVPMLFFGLIVIQLISKNQLEGVRERNMLQAIGIAEEVEAFLLEASSDLQMVKHVVVSEKIIESPMKNNFLNEVVGNSRFFESIYILDENHLVSHLGVLPKLQAKRDDYKSLDFSGHQLFQKAQEQGQQVWSNTFVSLVTGEPSVTLGMPSPNGFLMGNIRLTSLGRLLQRYAVNERVEVAIVDNTGTLVAHNVSEMAMQRINFGNHPAVISAMKGQDATLEFRRGDGFFLESATRIHEAEWIVWVGLDMHAVLAPINKTRNLLVGFMVAAVILASTIALFNIPRLMKPLTSLGEKTGKIAEGYYEFEFRPSGFAEIDNLANQIANMTYAIKIREESIVANEQRFRDLVNSIDGIVWEMSYPSLGMQFVSKQAETLLGYPLQDWYEIDSFWEKTIHADDRPQAVSYCRMMAKKSADHVFEYRMTAADGRLVWIRDLVTVVVEDRQPVRLLGVKIDITAEKELLDELSRSEQNYREIFNSTSDAIFIHDAENGQVLDVNQAMLEMYRCTYEEALVGGLEATSQGEAPYDLDAARGKMLEAREKGRCRFEWLSRKNNGELFWTEVNLHSAMIGDQERILAAVRDISERKKAEEELAKYRDLLEDLVRERTQQLELAQQELVQKERLAVLGQLTATVSHEIRNPLGTVANALYLLKENLSDVENTHLARPLKLAERNVERCDNIISDLLDFSRQRDIRKEPLEIDVWLTELLQEMSLPDNVMVRCTFAVNRAVMADVERLRRVMVNAVTNAMQAFDEVQDRDKNIEIQTWLADHRCNIQVRDNGMGMGREVMARIFEPMFSTKNFGVGLGVPIIKNIMEGHGGGVEYQSEVGEGTTVLLWLPCESEATS